MRQWQDMIPIQASVEERLASVSTVLSKIEWFANVGRPLLVEQPVALVCDWNETRTIFDDFEGKKYGPNGHLVRAVDALKPALKDPVFWQRWDDTRREVLRSAHYGHRIPAWTKTIDTPSIRTMRDEIREYCYEFVSFLVAEVMAGDLVSSDYFRDQLEWFSAGRYPCGWEGDWPAGSFRVY